MNRQAKPLQKKAKKNKVYPLSNLMAVAPELLEACKELVIEVEDGDFAALVPSTVLAVIDDTIKPLIAKATGRDET